MGDIPDQLKKARQQRGLKQSALGAKLGLPQSHISRIERGDTDPRLSTITELTRLLDLELVLVPRQLVPAIRALVQGTDDEPIWKPDEDGEP